MNPSYASLLQGTAAVKCIERSTLESSYTPSKTLRKPYISCCQPEWATVAAGEAVGACAEILRLTENPYKTKGKPPFSTGQEKLSTSSNVQNPLENKLFCPGQIKLIARHRLSKLIAFHVIWDAVVENPGRSMSSAVKYSAGR